MESVPTSTQTEREQVYSPENDEQGRYDIRRVGSRDCRRYRGYD
jgi:hypothetical protein